MEKIIIVMLLASLPFFILSQAKAVDTDSFTEKAYVAGEFEIESSQLALERSKHKDVKEFAQKMISDHKDAAEKLKEAVASANKSLIKTDFDKKHQDIMRELKRTSATAFDKKYIDVQLNAHKEAVALFDDYSKTGEDNTIKDYAVNTLPTLQSHLDHVKQLKNKYK